MAFWPRPTAYIGMVTASNGGFRLPNEDEDVRTPDASFILTERLPRTTDASSLLTN